MPAHEPANERMLLLYDGECRFCIASSRRLAAMARPGTIERIDLHDHAALRRHPCAPQNPDAGTIRLVMPDGRVAVGAEAIALALGTRPLWRLVTWVYRLPGVRQLADAAYRVVARHRFTIMGRVGDAGGRGSGGCESGACRIEAVESRRG